VSERADFNQVTAAIDGQIAMLLQARVMCSFMPDSAVGSQSFETAPYYAVHGLTCSLSFSAPLTRDDVERINALGHWINQNFLVRLCSILESNGVISRNSKIRTDVIGHEDVNILRRLRNEFAHGSGRYAASDREKNRLFDRIVSRYRVESHAYFAERSQFPLPIDKVVVPLAQGCRRYAAIVAER